MIKNPYSAQPTSSASLLPDPSILQFLKMYSQSLEVIKGKSASILVGKNWQSAFGRFFYALFWR